MILTKKYRLIWNEEKEIILDHLQDYSGSKTAVGIGLYYFESNNKSEIKAKITEESLIETAEEL